jgi:hypothetical protein
MIAVLIALVAFVLIGTISWATVRGYQGVGICVALGAAAGAALKGPGSRLARVLGGGSGGAVAGSFAVAAAEVLPPGTMQWTLAGAGYGAVFGLPVATVMGGLIGLLGAMSRCLKIGNAPMDRGLPTGNQ